MATVPVPLHPFGAVATRSGGWIFVSVSNGTASGGGIAVLRRDARQLCVVRVVPMPGTPLGLTLTHLSVGNQVLAGRSGTLGTIPAGAFPRELSLSDDGHTLLLTNDSSGTVQLFDVARLSARSTS